MQLITVPRPLTDPSADNAAKADPIVLERFLPYRLSVLANTVSRSLARTYSAQFDLSVPEWRVMAVLARMAPLSAGEVADRAAMDKVQVSRAVTRLCERALLNRQADGADRRRQRLELSRAGWKIYRRIVPPAQALQDRLEAALTPAEARQLDSLLSKLQDAADSEAGA